MGFRDSFRRANDTVAEILSRDLATTVVNLFLIVVYALVLIALAVYGAGRTWGLGAMWERLPFVQRYSFLR